MSRVALFKKDISKLSDEALMALLIRKDDQRALTILYQRYATRLLGYFIKMFRGDADKSQDFLQDLFLKIMHKKHLFNLDMKFYTWVFTMASNMCKTEFRKPIAQRLSAYDIPDDRLVVAADNALDKALFKSHLRTAVHALDYHHKVVFILRFNEGFSLKEIATITEVSVGTVKSRLFYATKKIKEQLQVYDPNMNNNVFKMS